MWSRLDSFLYEHPVAFTAAGAVLVILLVWLIAVAF
jgi:hypothetical protein